MFIEGSSSPSPYSPEPEKVRKLFDGIAEGYDLFNAIASFGLDRIWRKKIAIAVKESLSSDQVILDIGTGTAGSIIDILKSSQASHGVKVLGIDFSYPMLRKAQQKLNQSSNVMLIQGSADAIPLRSGSVNVSMNAFVMRNVKKIMARTLLEIFRVTAHQGRAVFLEMYVPSQPLFRFLHKIYLNTVLAAVGRALFGARWSGRYLPDTIFNFGTPFEFSKTLENAGFTHIQHQSFHGGIAVLHTATKE